MKYNKLADVQSQSHDAVTAGILPGGVTGSSVGI